jgi:eukaryotic-like serine/threonine-protein kinase
VNAGRWQQINHIFHEALELDAAGRETYLHTATAGDPELLREVRTLLTSHAKAGAFLDRPAWAVEPELAFGDDHSLVGKQIGTYRILEEIGRGGMGVVYAAEDQRLRRTVALKALTPEYTRDPRRRERLTREARAAAALLHPAIATIFALEEIDGELYITSELVRGRTLREELQDGPLPPPQLLSILIAIAAALAAAHEHGIVHRDLKPENIIRRDDGQIKILDFGLARWESSGDVPSVTRLTEAGVALGTPGYMAPEQLRGARGDARSDIFAFGVVAWELATGEHPFGADPGSILARMTELMEGRAGSLSRPLPLAGLDRVARRCMRGLPEDRYQGAAALLEDLRSLTPLRASGTRSTPLAWDNLRGVWWWSFHQASVAGLDATAPILAWIVRRWIDQPYARWIFFAVLALATTAVTLRLNLLFTARVQPSMLADHRSHLFRWIAIAETLLALVLLGTAVALGGASDITSAALVGIAVVTLASLAIIEPATSVAAGLGNP